MKRLIQSLLSIGIGVSLFIVACSHLTLKRARCNPLGGSPKEDCFLPYPSSFYLRQDSSTETGWRVHLTGADLPVSMFGVALDPSQYENRDGFSPVSTLLAYFPARLDGSSLPGPDRLEDSLKETSPVQVFEYGDTGKRVPLFAELDANANPGSHSRQALIVQPSVRLKPKTRYVVAIQGLKTIDGKEVPPLSGFRVLRDSLATSDPKLKDQKSKYEELFQFLADSGIQRKKLQLAWDFTTGSDEGISDRLLQMRDHALNWVDQIQSSFSHPIRIEESKDHPSRIPGLFRQILGRFRAPSFLVEGNGNRLRLGENGEPLLDSYVEFPLTIHVPKCALQAEAPLPVMIYGHGTFNSAENEMSRPYSTEMSNRLCMIQVGTDWLGRAKSDLSYFIFRVIPNWNNFKQITDRLQQAHVNVLTLARLVKSGALNRLPALQWQGRSLVDEKKVYYYGISEGGCQGITTLALSPDLDRGALNVPCGFWSMFFWRSSDFYYPRRALNVIYPDSIEQQELMALSQLHWDYTDPANYASHVIRDPFPGNQPKKILYQEGINDASVPNVTTRAMVRTLGLPLLQPRVESVSGVPEAKGPLPSGYVQFDVGLRPRLGKTNIPPAVTPVHEEIRRLEAVKEQLQRFLKEDGKVEDTCGGKPCLFPQSSRS